MEREPRDYYRLEDLPPKYRISNKHNPNVYVDNTGMLEEDDAVGKPPKPDFPRRSNAQAERDLAQRGVKMSPETLAHYHATRAG